MSNSKVVVLGCSFSKWSKKGDDSCWPNILSTLADRNIDVYNLAIYGNSLEYQVIQLHHILDTQKCDFIIWQVPPRFRGTFLNCELDTAMSVTSTLSATKQKSENYFVPNESADVIQWNSRLAPSLSKLRNNILKHNASHHYNLRDDAWFTYGISMLERRNKPYLTFQHVDKNFDTDFTVQNELAESQWNQFVADNGFHFNEEGSEYVATELVYPRIKDRV